MTSVKANKTRASRPWTRGAFSIQVLQGACSLVAVLVATNASGAEGDKRQDGHDPDDPEFRAEAPSRPQDMPLAELPEPPSLELSAPRPRALEAIDRLLAEITSEDELVRLRTRRTLLEAKSDWVSGIARRISELREASEPKAQKALLAQMREQTRSRLSAEGGKVGETPDYLDVALEHADPTSSEWRNLTKLLAASRMLSAIGSTEATREIIRIYQRFGEYMRVDCQRQLEAMGEYAVAGLIEAQNHEAQNVSSWAKRLLLLQKKSNAHEAVRTKDDRALADILVALGRHRDPDSTQILISFAGTERAQIRRAARRGLALLGEVGSWQLKDAYLNTTGKHPPRDWTWKRTARELFTEFDRLRLAQAYSLYEVAEAARKSGDLEKMRQSYDEVLALNPGFDKQKSMAEGYISYAASVEGDKPREALLALRRAERVAPSEAQRHQAEGKRLLLEAELLRKKGLIDQHLIRQAVGLSPEIRSEGEALLVAEQNEEVWARSSRYFIAAITSGLALLGTAWVLLGAYRRRRKDTKQPEN